MLRFLTLALVLANAVYFAWTQGLLADYGFAPVSQAEPQRMTQQIRPEAMRVLTPAEARQLDGKPSSGSASSAESAGALPAAPGASAPAGAASGSTASISAAVAGPTECLQAGLFNDAQADRLRTRLEGLLPVGSWSLENKSEPGRWIIYMGKYANEEALAKKRNELRGLGQSVEPLMVPWLNPGLSLGHYSSPAEAERELAKAATRGVRTAKVMMERADASGQLLRLTSVDASLKQRLVNLKPQLEGKALQRCN